MTGYAQQQEARLKKKLQAFLAEMLKLGTVKGFKYFATYMRGREEMVISIVNQPQSMPTAQSGCVRDKGGGQQRKQSVSESFSSNNLPYDQRSLMLSIRSQMLLSSHGVKDVGLPPASPSDGESLPMDENATLFMIAGYSRYSCPYVWVRSNHERLVKLTGDSAQEKDCPLKLKSTLKWNDCDVYVWDIVAELVKLCTYPAPQNPFAIDYAYFNLLPVPEAVLATAAMANTLQKILLHTPDHKHYAAQVFEDLQLITRQHFATLERWLHERGLPALQQAQTPAPRSRTSYNQPAAPRSRTSSYNQPAAPPQPPPSTNYGYTQTAMF